MNLTKEQYQEKAKEITLKAEAIATQTKKQLQGTQLVRLRLKPSPVWADDFRFMYTVRKELERVGIVTEVLNDCDGFSYIKASR